MTASRCKDKYKCTKIVLFKYICIVTKLYDTYMNTYEVQARFNSKKKLNSHQIAITISVDLQKERITQNRQRNCIKSAMERFTFLIHICTNV